jgi:hypothetical protein
VRGPPRSTADPALSSFYSACSRAVSVAAREGVVVSHRTAVVLVVLRLARARLGPVQSTVILLLTGECIRKVLRPRLSRSLGPQVLFCCRSTAVRELGVLLGLPKAPRALAIESI